MKITTENLDIDWKEAFFVLAVLVNGNEIAEAKKYIQLLLRRPTIHGTNWYCVCGQLHMEGGSYCDVCGTDRPRRSS